MGIKMWTNKRSNGEHRLVKKTQLLEMTLDGVNADIKSLKSSLSLLHQCQIGLVKCSTSQECGGIEANGYKIHDFKKAVTFAVPFTSVPKVVMASARVSVKTNDEENNNVEDWWGFHTYPDSVTTTGFTAILSQEDVKFFGFSGTW